MKRIIAAITLTLTLAATANAGVLAYIENEAGGTIRFTDSKCRITNTKEAKRWHAAYTTSGNGAVVDGCWIWDDDTSEMVTVYENAEVRRYPAESATFTDYFHEMKGRNEGKQQQGGKPTKKKGKTL